MLTDINIWALSAGILTLIAFFAHAVIGDKEFQQLKPAKNSHEKNNDIWLQTRSGWHRVSVDLFLSGVLFIIIAASDLIQAETVILLLLSIYFLLLALYGWSPYYSQKSITSRYYH